MQEMHIAMCLIEQADAYLLQHRLGDPKIGAANLIGCFGGKIEDGETAKQAICRELSEETNLNIGEADLTELGNVEVISDYQHKPVAIFSTAFRTVIGKEITVEAKEGILVRVPKRQYKDYLDKMTPATRACFEQLMTKE